MFVPKIEEEPQRIIEQKIDKNRLVSVGTDFALLALCLLAAFVSFWDVGFSINKAFTVGWLSILIFIVSTTTYRNKYDGGIYKGRQTTEYKTAKASFEKIRDFIVAKSLINTASKQMPTVFFHICHHYILFLLSTLFTIFAACSTL